MFISVAIPPLENLYTYRVDPEFFAQKFKELPPVGYLVKVPLGRTSRDGYVISHSDTNNLPKNIKLKTLKSGNFIEQVFNSFDLRFFRWMANYYATPLSNTLDTAIPKLSAIKTTKIFSLAVKYAIGESDACGEKLPRGKKQQEIVKFLDINGGSCNQNELKSQNLYPSQSLNKLIKEQKVSLTEKVENFSSSTQSILKPTPVTLNVQQESAALEIISSIKKDKFSPFLLEGVTGSGKTEVYINCLIECLKDKTSGALVLVPEISLTPQLIQRLENKIGEHIAVLHSALTQSAKSAEWRALQRGEKRVALGARSAIFAPVKNLKLIIVDEEHDGSFKQSDSLRYNGRDLAIVRASLNKATIVLGSATPSLETLNNGVNGKFKHLKITQRYGDAKPPEINIIDLTKIKKKSMSSPSISPQLNDAILKTLENKKQIFLLLNRRGFSNAILCTKCGATTKCTHCDVTYTYHEAKNKAICHMCGTSTKRPTNCHVCGSENIIYYGSGTEKVFDEVSKLYPEARVARLDRDTASSLKKYEEILTKIKNHEFDILVGTQMIAKGHDIPNVTLVGIIDSDVGIHFPDFRSSERTIQLLIQASGRAGRRGDSGSVFLQTRSPKHPSIDFAKRHNYQEFARKELQNRELLNYPPYSKLLRIVVSAENPNTTYEAIQIVKKLITLIQDKVDFHFSVLGPTLAPISKIKDRWRWHILIKSEHPRNVLTIVKTLKNAKQLDIKKGGKNDNLRITYDIDPLDML